MAFHRRIAKRLLERFATPPFGVDLHYDIHARLPNERITSIIDVGANIGQSALAFAAAYPSAAIHCFEPVTATFNKLENATKPLGRQVHCIKLAVGNSIGDVMFDGSAQSSDLFRQSDTGAEKCLMTTLDEYYSFLGRQSAEYSLLKIDTEGHDLEVLKGAKKILGKRRLSIIQTECSANSGNTYHAPFCAIQSYLEGHDYRLFGVYDQVSEWPTGEPHLRRINAVFISPKVIERNRTSN
jgi:FkbM family methyltransferase